MTIDPRVGLWISVVAAVLMFTAGASSTLTDLFDVHTAKVIVAGSTFFGGIISAVNAVLHAIPSKAGATEEFPLGPKP
jgi:hypothetical protein